MLQKCLTITLLSHCDPDHARSATLFDEIYMSNLEEESLKNGSIKQQVRFMLAKNNSAGNK